MGRCLREDLNEGRDNREPVFYSRKKKGVIENAGLSGACNIFGTGEAT